MNNPPGAYFQKFLKMWVGQVFIRESIKGGLFKKKLKTLMKIQYIKFLGLLYTNSYYIMLYAWIIANKCSVKLYANMNMMTVYEYILQKMMDY